MPYAVKHHKSLRQPTITKPTRGVPVGPAEALDCSCQPRKGRVKSSLLQSVKPKSKSSQSQHQKDRIGGTDTHTPPGLLLLGVGSQGLMNPQWGQAEPSCLSSTQPASSTNTMGPGELLAKLEYPGTHPPEMNPGFILGWGHHPHTAAAAAPEGSWCR